MITRLWPAPGPLDDDALRDAYAPDRAAPHLRVNFVTSLDGAVSVDGRSRGLSDPADQKVLVLLRAHTDAVLVGAGTMRQEGYGPLKVRAATRDWRAAQGLAETPTQVLVSRALDLDPDHALFRDAPVRPVVLTCTGADPGRRAALGRVADVVAVGDSDVDLVAGVAELHQRGLTQLLCEGGPHLHGSLLAADLVDELCLSISPLLAGPGAGRIIAGPPVETPRPLRLHQVIAADDLLLTRYLRA